MSNLIRRARWFLSTTEGLLLVVTAWDALIIAFLSTLSEPMSFLGLQERLGIVLDDAGRVGRIIMLYHALAVPFVAALVYFVLDLLPFDPKIPRIVRPTITVGYMLSSAGGIGFAYLGGGWIAHGFFLVGLSLVFYAGVVLCVGLWPFGERFSWERTAFWLTALLTLISAAIGGAAGAYFGNGFSAFLAEDILRTEHNLGQRAIIAHLHIMLTLIDVMLLLIIARTFRLRGRAYRAALRLTLAGSVVTALATWSVMFYENAHKIINVGVLMLLPAAAIVAFQGFSRLARDCPRCLLRDPVRFGMLFELLFVNLVVTGPGVYIAINLDTYRQPAYLEVERTIAVGHWHVLATLSAVIALFLVTDRLDVRGRLRQLVGWGTLGGSTLAFVFVQFYMFRRPDQDTGWTKPFFNAGVGVLTLTLAALVLYQLLKETTRQA